MPIPILKDNTIISIMGKKGSGKSYLTKEIMYEWPRVIIVDNTGEYETEEIYNGYDECVSALVNASKRNQFRISLRTRSVEDDLRLLEIVETIPSILLVVEEASRYVSSAFLPPEIEALIRYGRHKDISQIYLARRPTELHRDLTANSDVIVVFNTQEPRDINYLRSFIGEQAQEAIRLDAEKYELIYWTSNPKKVPLAVLSR